ncbi:sensor histidine kinase [Salinispirillum marinum]|uniref:histidine kinase n=2 Tax=Saccharospirillaceae TaxID=255527 RepID=A0ABV8BIP3_9GAMM
MQTTNATPTTEAEPLQEPPRDTLVKALLTPVLLLIFMILIGGIAMSNLRSIGLRTSVMTQDLVPNTGQATDVMRSLFLERLAVDSFRITGNHTDVRDFLLQQSVTRQLLFDAMETINDAERLKLLHELSDRHSAYGRRFLNEVIPAYREMDALRIEVVDRYGPEAKRFIDRLVETALSSGQPTEVRLAVSAQAQMLNAGTQVSVFVTTQNASARQEAAVLITDARNTILEFDGIADFVTRPMLLSLSSIWSQYEDAFQRLVFVSREYEAIMNEYILPEGPLLTDLARDIQGDIFGELQQLGDASQSQVASTNAVTAGLIVVVLILGGGLALISVRDTHQRKRYEHALEVARNELEQRVVERTVALSVSNQRLREEVDQHHKTQNELIQTAKLAVLGQLSAGINHELNQPLTAIRAFAENAVRFLERSEPEQAQKNLQRIAELGQRMGEIIARFKVFARKGDTPMGVVSLQASVQGALTIVNASLKRHQVQAQSSVTDDELVQADMVYLEQVLVNLLSNAVDAVVENPHSLRRVDVYTEPCPESPEHLVVVIGDDGVGLDEAHVDRVFEPFFTTKQSGVGLGLGLSISHRIVEALNGDLWARPGRLGGAEFCVRLTRADEAESRLQENRG